MRLFGNSIEASDDRGYPDRKFSDDCHGTWHAFELKK